MMLPQWLLIIFLLVLAGSMFSILLDAIWCALHLDKRRGRLDPLEHYHWGLICIIMALLSTHPIIWIIRGVGLGLLALECLQDHPFAVGSDHFKASTVIGIILLMILLIVDLLRV